MEEGNVAKYLDNIQEGMMSRRKFAWVLTGSLFGGFAYLIYSDVKKEEKKLKDFKENEFHLKVGDIRDMPPFNKSGNSKISYQGFSDSKEYIKVGLIKHTYHTPYPISFNYPASSKEINIDGTSFSVMKITEEELILKYLNTQK